MGKVVIVGIGRGEKKKRKAISQETKVPYRPLPLAFDADCSRGRLGDIVSSGFQIEQSVIFNVNIREYAAPHEIYSTKQM